MWVLSKWIIFLQPSIVLIAVIERVCELKLWMGFLSKCSENAHNKINADLLETVRSELNGMLEKLRNINTSINISASGWSRHDVSLYRQQEKRAQNRLNHLRDSSRDEVNCGKLHEINNFKNRSKDERESQRCIIADAEHIAGIHLRFLFRRLFNLLQKQQQS